MAVNVGQMSTDELREITASVVEQKPKEIPGDPDEALEMRANVRNRLLRQKQRVANGERGEEVAKLPHFASPHFANPEQAKDFEKRIIDDTTDANV